MRLAIAAIMVLWATWAESQWVGKTLSAKFEVTLIACKPDGACQRFTQKQTDINVYVSSNKNVFDYVGKSNGVVAKLGEWRQSATGQEKVEIDKDALMYFAKDASSVLMVMFLVKGRQCSIGAVMRMVDTSIKVHSDIRTQYCRVKNGNIPP